MQQQHSLLMGDGAAVGARRVAATAVVPDLEPCARRAAARVGQGAARSCDRKRVPSRPRSCWPAVGVDEFGLRRGDGALGHRGAGDRPPGAPGARVPRRRERLPVGGGVLAAATGVGGGARTGAARVEGELGARVSSRTARWRHPPAVATDALAPGRRRPGRGAKSRDRVRRGGRLPAGRRAAGVRRAPSAPRPRAGAVASHAARSGSARARDGAHPAQGRARLVRPRRAAGPLAAHEASRAGAAALRGSARSRRSAFTARASVVGSPGYPRPASASSWRTQWRTASARNSAG